METLETLGKRAKTASRLLAGAGSEQKNAALQAVAQALLNQSGAILEANAADVAAARAAGASPRTHTAAKRPDSSRFFIFVFSFSWKVGTQAGAGAGPHPVYHIPPGPRWQEARACRDGASRAAGRSCTRRGPDLPAQSYRSASMGLSFAALLAGR